MHSKTLLLFLFVFFLCSCEKKRDELNQEIIKLRSHNSEIKFPYKNGLFYDDLIKLDLIGLNKTKILDLIGEPVLVGNNVNNDFEYYRYFRIIPDDFFFSFKGEIGYSVVFDRGECVEIEKIEFNLKN